jgi:hypothetical protein
MITNQYKSTKSSFKREQYLTIELRILAILEELQGGVTLHIETLGRLRVNSGIELHKLGGRILQEASSLGVLRGQGLAVAAPGSI